MATVNNQGCVPTEWKSVLNDEMIAAAGHWTPDNCRKRLSMFCNYERISCEILNTALGLGTPLFCALLPDIVSDCVMMISTHKRTMS